MNYVGFMAADRELIRGSLTLESEQQLKQTTMEEHEQRTYG